LLIIRRDTDHYVEWYYDMPTPKHYFLQYMPLENDQLVDKTQNCIGVAESPLFIEEIEDAYGIYNVREFFDFIDYSSFYTFFTENRVDVPRFLRKTKSVRRSVNDLEFIKFNNYFMRKGMRYRTLNLLNTSLFNLHTDFKDLKDLVSSTPSSWKDFYLLFTNLRLRESYKQFSFDKNEVTTFGNTQGPLYKDILTCWYNHRILFQNIHDLLPVFCFYIYKVDKQIFKNTRGRSGKYTFIWKYVTQYKRPQLAMSWIMKELRITPGRTLPDRLMSLLRNFIFSHRKTWVWRVKKFSHNYVYRNCRFTLAESYRTVTR